jgi:starch phosphorylase
MAAVGAQPEAIARTQARLDPGAMTLGFARRFATYKRPNLLLHDTDRLLSILNHPERRIQLLLAGKAHPADQAGQALIQAWTQFIERSDGTVPVFFLADYDMRLAEHLVQGVDVWINTPQRPWEASGTSGMKVLVNGGINVSELDGWWAEAYAPEVGWALGDGHEHGDDPAWDAVEAGALYDLLERQVIPEFFARTDQGIPTAWVARMRESMARLTPTYSASRTVREYTEQHYLPAALAYLAHVADNGAAIRKQIDGQNALAQRLSALRFGAVTVETVGAEHRIAAQVFLKGIPPDMVRVELYADADEAGGPLEKEMTVTVQPTNGSYLYRATVSSARPATDYTPRIVLSRDSLSQSSGWILWQS